MKLAPFLLLSLLSAPARAQKPSSAPAETPVQLVQRQVEAYNAHDAARFAATYAENVEVLDFPATVQLTGRAKLAAQYAQMFSRVPTLHCEIRHRTVLGSRIIDEELVTGLPGGKTMQAVAIYEVENGLIRRVTFVQ